MRLLIDHLIPVKTNRSLKYIGDEYNTYVCIYICQSVTTQINKTRVFQILTDKIIFGVTIEFQKLIVRI